MEWAFLLFMAAGIAYYFWQGHRIQNLHDPIDGEPILIEKARVHTKSSYRYSDSLSSVVYYIGFYVPERNFVVECKVHKSIWKRLNKGDWGFLCHQGGFFFSYNRNGELIYKKDRYTQKMPMPKE